VAAAFFVAHRREEGMAATGPPVAEPELLVVRRVGVMAAAVIGGLRGDEKGPEVVGALRPGGQLELLVTRGKKKDVSVEEKRDVLAACVIE
jgi:hypothetical protein